MHDPLLDDEDDEAELRFSEEQVLAEFDFTNGTNQVWYGRLCSARIDEDDRAQIELHDFDGETHQIEVPPYRVDDVRAMLGKPIHAACWETVDDDGNVKVKLYFMDLLSPYLVGPRKSKKSLRELAEEQGREPMTIDELVPLLEELFPTREDAVRFGRDLERMRGRKIYDD